MKKHYELPNSVVNIIHNVMEKEGFKYEVEAVRFIIIQYEYKEKFMKDVMAAFDEKYKDLFTRLRLGTRTAEQNSIVLLDAINTLLYQFDGIDKLMPAGSFDTVNPVVKESKVQLAERINAYKQRKNYSSVEKVESEDEE